MGTWGLAGSIASMVEVKQQSDETADISFSVSRLAARRAGLSKTGPGQRLPLMAAALMPRELACWGYSAIALGALEGGLLGVIVKFQFADAAPAALLNFAVALAAGAPSFANLASFYFSNRARGRHKPELISRLILLMGGCLLLLALVPFNGAGLVWFCALVIVARAAWAGVLTVRAAVWRANYQRAWRARVTARIVQLSSLLIAAYAALIGLILEWQPAGFRVMFVLAALSAFYAARRYRPARVRRQRKLLAAELAQRQAPGRRRDLGGLWTVLRNDRDFRHYMACMMVFGSGNLMVIPLLIVIMGDQLGISQAQQVLLTSSLPLVVLFFAVRAWAPLLDSRHIFAYRAIHSWFYVATIALFLTATATGETLWLWPASLVLGAGHAGAHLGWNLGHNDFSSDANAAQYMAIHVTLTGLRGLVMPIVGISVYQALLLWQPEHAATLALLLPLLLSGSGAIAFVFLAAGHRRRAEAAH